MPVLYGDFNVIPCRDVALGSRSVTTGDGRKLGTVVTATLTGTLVPVKIDGVHQDVAIDSRLTTILAQQKRLRDAFRESGKLFQVQGWDGGVPMRFPARVVDVSFQPGEWVERCDYTIQLEGPLISGEDDDSPYIESCRESWRFEEDERTWMTRASHSIQVTGKTEYDGLGGIVKPAWVHARDFALGKLGLGWTTVGDSKWSPASGQTIAADSAAFQSGTLAWNPSKSDSVDELDGTYEVTESWTLANQPWWEESRTSVKATQSDPTSMVSASIQGVIHGLFADQGDYQTALANAKVAWAAIRPTLGDRARDAAPAVSPAPISAEFEFNERDGSVSYAYEFNDRPIVDGTWETYSVSPRASVDDYKTVVSISGVIRGVLDLAEEFDPAVKLARAEARWEDVRTTLLARAIAHTEITDLKAFPVSASRTIDPIEGSVSYQYEFDNRSPENVDDEFTVSRRDSIESGETIITVEGSIKGLRSANPDEPARNADREERYNTAKAYFDAKAPNLYGLAAIYVDAANVNPIPRSKSVSHNPQSGVVSYQYEFSTRKNPCFAGALSETINIQTGRAVPVIAQQAIPGRASGPIIQDMNTVTAKEREVSVEVVFPPGNACAAEPPSLIDMDRFKPTGSNIKKTVDRYNWSPTTSRLSWTVSWIYT